MVSRKLPRAYHHPHKSPHSCILRWQPDDTLTAALDGGPSHGTLSLNLNGGFSHTPATKFSGSGGFTYYAYANDGKLDSCVATVTITVNPVNDPPVAYAQTVTTEEDTAKAITLTGSDVDGTR